MRVPRPRGSSRLRADIREGLAFVRPQPLVRILTLLGIGNSVTSGAVLGPLAVYATRGLGLDVADGRIGLLYTAIAVGALLAALLVAPLGRRVRPGWISLGALTANPLLLTAVALAPALSSALPLLAAWGSASTLAILNGITVRQLLTPDRLQSRVNSTARLVVWGGTPFGAVAAGVLAQQTGVRGALLAATGAVALSAAAGWRSGLRHLDLRSEAAVRTAEADRADPGRGMTCVRMTRVEPTRGTAVMLGALAVLVGTGVATIWLLYLVAFAVGVAEAAHDNAVQSLVPHLVPDADLERANGQLLTVGSVGQDLIGPALGGLLFAAVAAAPFGVNAAGAALVRGLPAAPVSRAGPLRPRGVFRDSAYGLRWLLRAPLLRTVISPAPRSPCSPGSSCWCCWCSTNACAAGRLRPHPVRWRGRWGHRWAGGTAPGTAHRHPCRPDRCPGPGRRSRSAARSRAAWRCHRWSSAR